MPFYLRPSAPTAADGLICGDPARALTIAQHVMVQPRMSNHNRGLWGYYGETPGGLPITVQATGIGGPSAVAVLTESIELGLRRVIRIGTCSAPSGDPALGSAVIVETAIGSDGVSHTLNGPSGAGDEPIHPDHDLTSSLSAAAGAPTGSVQSVDLIDGAGSAGSAAVSVVDLQSAAVLSLCRRRGVAAAAGLVVARSAGRRLEDEPLDAALLRLAAAAITAMTDSQPRAEA